jgi:hypothetical protein
MSKYESLTKHLARVNVPELTMSFAQVEEILGAPLPASARTHRPWWANSGRGHVQSKGWLDAGYQSERVDLEGETLMFKKVQDKPTPQPGSEAQNSARHPLIGWAKGTVKVAEGVDLTAPLFTDVEMDAWADAKAARIAAGMPR